MAIVSRRSAAVQAAADVARSGCRSQRLPIALAQCLLTPDGKCRLIAVGLVTTRAKVTIPAWDLTTAADASLDSSSAGRQYERICRRCCMNQTSGGARR